MITPHTTSAALASIALAYHAHTFKDAVPDTPPFPRTRREYVSIVGAAVHGYLETGSRSHKNAMRRAVTEKFPNAFYRGYGEVGGEDTEDEDEKWLTDKENAELGYIDDLFVSLKKVRDGGEFDSDAIADSHAEGYANTLDAVYSEGRLRGDRNKMYTFVGDDGKENCATCKRLKGKRMKAKKIIEQELLPAPGNENFDCLCYECQHYWEDDDGKKLR